ncbi:hypothetical protein [Vagococcus penaei]|uniref:Gram-positive cocci surface proteins LPxTG domain-containing protein n=1 Tax=Vagococcus penaei TaxID=633807 RepID=A0A1Q2D4J8_9ENTE|nr:hypothetical protein [Vagococcus penaei]AQP53283.1 hypothetical protein BW732_02880 [Vagococcus penaei]
MPVDEYETEVGGTIIINTYQEMEGLLPDTGGILRQKVIDVGAFIVVISISSLVYIRIKKA